MTAAQPAGRKPTTPGQSIPSQRVLGVFGTGGMKPAVLPQHRTDRIPVNTDQQKNRKTQAPVHEEPGRPCDLFRAGPVIPDINSASCPGITSGVSGWPVSRISRSLPANRLWFVRNHSRMRRLDRLRSTARASRRFGTITAILEIARPLGRTLTETREVRRRLAVRNISSMTGRPRRCAGRNRAGECCRPGMDARNFRRRAWHAPWHGARG